MERKLYQLCNHRGEEWALILTDASAGTIESIWKQVMKEEDDNTDVDDDPLDRFLERIGHNTERIYISEYIMS